VIVIGRTFLGKPCLAGSAELYFALLFIADKAIVLQLDAQRHHNTVGT